MSSYLESNDETQHLGYGVSLKGKQLAVPFSIMRLELNARVHFVADSKTLLRLFVI